MAKKIRKRGHLIIKLYAKFEMQLDFPITISLL